MIKEEISKVFEKITDIYIAVIVMLFPLIIDSTGFFNIQECKYRAFVIISGLYLFANIVAFLYFTLVKETKVFERFKLNKIQILALAFWLINVISCIFSPFRKEYNLWLGMGRGEGLFMISLYVFTFFSITLFGKFKKRHIVYFSITSILVNFIAILQFIGFNPFNMYRDGIGTHNVSFMTTIGNVDFISALYCILLTISFTAYIFLDNSKWEKIIHLASITMGSFIFNIIDVNSGKVAFLFVLAMVFPYIITNSKRLRLLIHTINCVLIANCINYILNTEYHYDIAKIVFNLQFNYVVLAFIFVIAILFVLSRIIKGIDYDITENKKVIKGIFISYAVAILIGVVGLYAVDLHLGMLTEVHNMLHGHFEDDYGTYRVFLWRRTLSIIPEYPLIGSGSDTFAIRFMSKFSEDVASIGEYTINDTAANVYLTMTINIGIIGALIYIAFCILQVIKGFKNIKEKEVIVLFMAVMCYMVQDLFNLWVVIITPVYWCLLGIFLNCIKSKESVEKSF